MMVNMSFSYLTFVVGMPVVRRRLYTMSTSSGRGDGNRRFKPRGDGNSGRSFGGRRDEDGDFNWKGGGRSGGEERRNTSGRERRTDYDSLSRRTEGSMGYAPKAFRSPDRNREDVPLSDIQIAIKSDHDLVFGANPVLAALKSNRRIDMYAMWVSESSQKDREVAKMIHQLAKEKKVKLKSRPKGDLNSLCGNRPHQGFILEASPLDYVPIEALETCTENQVWLCLDEVTDPMNFGALVRSAFFLQCHGIVVSEKNCCPITPTASKASSGALEAMPVHAARNLPTFLRRSRDAGWKIIGAQMSPTATEAKDLNLDGPTILVLGSEGRGLRKTVSNTHGQNVPSFRNPL